MPTTDQIAAAAKRREQRRLAREQNAADSEAQLQQVSKKSETQAVKTDRPSDPGSTMTSPTVDVATTSKKPSRRELVAAKRKAAAEQAERDVRVEVPEPDVSQYLKPGSEPPLHVLNKMAKDASRAIREDAAAIAQAAGKAAYAEAAGRRAARGGTDYVSRVQKVAAEAAKMAQKDAGK